MTARLGGRLFGYPSTSTIMSGLAANDTSRIREKAFLLLHQAHVVSARTRRGNASA